MVRVSHPPGGRMQLHDPPTPEPKSVRVLKPPGGGSSISFDEEDISVKEPKAASKQAAENSTPTSAPSTPAAVEQPPTDASKDAPSFPAPVGEPSMSPSNGEAKPSDTSKTNGHQPTESKETVKETNGTAIECPAANGIAVPSDFSQKCASEDGSNKPDGTVQQVSDGVKDLSVSKPVLHLNINTTPKTTDTVDTSACNSKTQSASTTSSSSPAVSSPTTPPPSVASPSIRSNDVPTTPTSELSSRKVKDHMRSSIFAHDDQLPSKSPSSHNSGAASNSATASNSAAQQPSPAPRQRVPPGGFSSKLW